MIPCSNKQCVCTGKFTLSQMNKPQQSACTIGLIRFFRFVVLGFGVLLGLHSLLADANFTVSGGQFGAPFFNFAGGAGQTPDFSTLPLYRGATYQFSDSGVSSSHPFMIGESNGDTTSSLVREVH